MSSAEVAVQVFKELEIEDFRILNIIEAGMSKHEFVPKEQIQRYAKLPMDRIDFTLGQTKQAGLNVSNKRNLQWTHPKLRGIRLPSHKRPC